MKLSNSGVDSETQFYLMSRWDNLEVDR